MRVGLPMADAPRGYARVLVAAPFVTTLLTDGWTGARPLSPLPKDAILETVALADDIVTLTFSSVAWVEPLRDAKALDVRYARHGVVRE